MTKIEKEVLQEFITKVIKSGKMVNNAQLPVELQSKNPDGSPNLLGGSKITSLSEILNHWSECVKSLENINENQG